MARRRQAIKYSALGWHGKVFRTTGYWCGESTGVLMGVFGYWSQKNQLLISYRHVSCIPNNNVRGIVSLWKTQSKYNTAFNCRDKENIRKHLILPAISHLNIWRWNIIYWVIFRKDTVCVVQVCLEAPNVISCLPCPSSCQPAGQKLHL